MRSTDFLALTGEFVQSNRSGYNLSRARNVTMMFAVRLLSLCVLLISLSACHEFPKSDLCAAAEEGDVELVRKLILSGEKVNEPDANGLTPLAWAARDSGAAVIPVLVNAGALVNQRARGWPPLMYAAQFNKIDNALALLSNGADINARTDTRFHNGYTALMFSIEVAHDNFTAFLLDHGADPSITAPDGATALTSGVAAGAPDGSGSGVCDTNVVRLLISRHPNLTIPNTPWGRRSLERARAMHCEEVLSLIHER